MLSEALHLPNKKAKILSNSLETMTKLCFPFFFLCDNFKQKFHSFPPPVLKTHTQTLNELQFVYF